MENKKKNKGAIPSKTAAKKTFKQAVEITPDVANCYQTGLKALGKHSLKIELADNLLCNGSLDIDTCTTKKYPGQNRWDYAFSYKMEVFFVEVHTANTGEVSTVLRKLQWLKDWLHNHAPEINKLKAKNQTPFYWIQSNGFHILPNSSQYRQAITAGIRPIAKLALN